jgi:hypothetical protein
MLAQVRSHPGPALVEVVVDRQELALPPSIKLDPVKGFSLFMMKAVINGRGIEVIDLLKTNPVLLSACGGSHSECSSAFPSGTSSLGRCRSTGLQDDQF